MSRNLKLAAVFDALADHFDAEEAEKTSTIKAARQAQIDELAGKYATATGEEMPASVRKKLAESDEDIVALVRGMAEKQASVVEPLGGPSDRRDGGNAALTTKEAADQADDRFLNWINS